MIQSRQLLLSWHFLRLLLLPFIAVSTSPPFSFSLSISSFPAVEPPLWCWSLCSLCLSQGPSLSPSSSILLSVHVTPSDCHMPSLRPPPPSCFASFSVLLCSLHVPLLSATSVSGFLCACLELPLFQSPKVCWLPWAEPHSLPLPLYPILPTSGNNYSGLQWNAPESQTDPQAAEGDRWGQIPQANHSGQGNRGPKGGPASHRAKTHSLATANPHPGASWLLQPPGQEVRGVVLGAKGTDTRGNQRQRSRATGRQVVLPPVHRPEIRSRPLQEPSQGHG